MSTEVQTLLAIEDGAPSGLRVSTGSRLLEPIRAKVARAQIKARGALDCMSDNCIGTMLWDWCSSAVDSLDGVWVAARDVRRNLRDAEERREGYDTWTHADLAAHIAELRTVHDALDELSHAVQHLAICEKQDLAEALHENKAMRHGAEEHSMDTITGQTPAQRRASDVASGAMLLLRRIPIDFRRVAEESGLNRGTVCHSPNFGWGVQNTQGVDGPSFGCITPPEMQPGETTLLIRENHWCFFGPAAPGDQQENTKMCQTHSPDQAPHQSKT